MTESEWLACDDPEEMLEFLESRASERKLRLFAVACCRSVWDQLTEPSLREAVEVAERFADGDATPDELRTASDAAWDTKYRLEEADEPIDPTAVEADLAAYHAAEAAAATSCEPDSEGTDYIFRALDTSSNVVEAISHTSIDMAAPAGKVRPPDTARRADLETRRVAALESSVVLLRDIFGNPFRSAVIDPVWLSSNVVALARTMYAERVFHRMPELADALEAAGCHDADILGHCRQAGPHVRGCWVVDVIPGKL